jgi:hypothetical protein
MTEGQGSRSPGPLATLAYGFAAVALTLGLVLTVAIISASGDLPEAMVEIRGLGPLLRPLAGPLHVAAEILGVAAFAVTIVISGLLLLSGWLLSTAHTLECRVRSLEAHQASVEGQEGLQAPGTDI